MRTVTSLTLVFLLGCGSAPDDVDTLEYQPKIVVNATLVAGNPIELIEITRNFPLQEDGAEIQGEELILADALVWITDLESGEKHSLIFDSEHNAFRHPDASLVVGYGQQYRIDVDAMIDGIPLHTWATTRVPERGFELITDFSNLGSVHYGGRPASVTFTRAPGIDFYAMVILALGANAEHYIGENPYVDLEPEEVEASLRDLTPRIQWVQNLPIDPNQEPRFSEMDVSWANIFFYQPHEVRFHACDRNLRDYFLTHATVQSVDGSISDPVFSLQGDGIGLFGSASLITFTFEVHP